jgi:hypothetical protein
MAYLFANVINSIEHLLAIIGGMASPSFSPSFSRVLPPEFTQIEL